ncbi:hypothetical protein ACVCIV_09175 [Enterococcus faecium]
MPFGPTNAFIEWADDMMLLEKWSPDVVVGFARKSNCSPGHYDWTTTLISGLSLWHHENEEYGPATKNCPANRNRHFFVSVAFKRVLGLLLKNPEVFCTGKPSAIGKSTRS